MKPRPSRVPGAVLYVAAWFTLFLLETGALRQTAATTYPLAMLYAGSYIGPAMLVGGLVWLTARRVAWRQLSGLKFILCELAFDVGFIVAWQGLFGAWLWLVAGQEVALANSWLAMIARGVPDAVRETAAWSALMAMLIVGVHAAVFHTVRILGELRTQELAAAEADSARTRAEMLALRGQLDPHFLFNSLHSITALVREDSRRAEDALLQFSALLRRVLALKRDSADEVTLADEMKFVDDYLAIERLRLGDRLRVTCEIADDARACRLPAFSVQPLVENSIRHAIEPRRDGGTLVIRARVSEGRLEVLVRDDGPGADAAKVANATGVGLSVIRQRLRLRHGDRAEVTTDTASGQGFSTSLSLPADTEGAGA